MAAERDHPLHRLLARFWSVNSPADASPPVLPLLEYRWEAEAAGWLRTSMTTFWESVASFLPGNFEAYARIYHPFDSCTPPGTRAPSWSEIAAAAGITVCDLETAMKLASQGAAGEQAQTGTVPKILIGPLVEHLERATTTPGHCFFALWEGFGDSPVPTALEPTLLLPHRRYHVFAGPIEGATTNLSASPIGHQAPNLWWPADHAWCLATEVDFAWTYVGGTRRCIDALLEDPRLESTETTAAARW